MPSAMSTINLYNQGSSKNGMFLQGAIARRGNIEDMLGRYVFFNICRRPKKCMRVEILYLSRGNLTLLKDMDFVTLGSKAKDTQSLGTSYHNFSPIICGLEASRASVPDFTNSLMKRRKL